MGFDTCQKWAKRASFVAVSKTLAGVGQLNRICKDASRVAGAVQETYSSEMLGGPGAGFLRGVRPSGLPRRFCVTARCSTSYDLASLFRGSRCALDRWSGKIAKRNGTRPLALHSVFHFWRTSSQNCFIFHVNSENWRISQNCFVFDVVNSENWRISQNYFVLEVVNFENWRSLEELLCFGCCQLRIQARR